MEREQIAGLTAELTAQLRLIERVYQRLDDRLSLGLETPAQLDSIAYQIHNLYCAIEDLLKLVANAFENRIGAGSEWHCTLLLRLSQPVQGVRPAFLSEEAFSLLNRLRGSRHFVRHGYGGEIEINQLRTNLDLAMQLKTLINQDLHLFLEEVSKGGDRE
ncbi:MAG: hypothetical protein NW224_10970 [Leptolyngbyaceae cyanobacterium bins.302]|nr:hypothetical protein [Leptolyngbyaceae cyanobacterium bins.302]